MHVHALPLVRLRHACAVTTATDEDARLVAGGGPGAAATGAGGGTLGAATGAADASESATGAGAGSADVGTGVAGLSAVGAGLSPAVSAGANAARSSRAFDSNQYQPAASNRGNTTLKTNAVPRDRLRVAGTAVAVRRVTGAADDGRGAAGDDGTGDAARCGGAAWGDGAGVCFGGEGGAVRGCGSARCGAGVARSGGAVALCGGVSLGSGGADDDAGAGEGATACGVLSGRPRALQNCSRFSRLVMTNGSFGGRLAVAIAYALR